MENNTIRFCSNCGARLDEDNLKCEREEIVQYDLALNPSPELAWEQSYGLEFVETDRDCSEERYYCANCDKTIEDMSYDEAVETLTANQDTDELSETEKFILDKEGEEGLQRHQEKK